MIFAGIGSRETPKEILTLMFWLGEALCDEGATLRSGGAPGADQAFESGYSACMNKGERFIQEHAEIYLPWKSFEKDNRSWIEPRLTEPAEWTYEIASDFHPSWQWLKPAVKKLMARNVHQVLGATEPTEIADCIICWTKDAKGGGGTGQALRIADHFGVAIFDLCDPKQRTDILFSFPGVSHAWRKLSDSKE